MKSRAPIIFALKLVIGLAILFFILRRVDSRSIWNAAASLETTTITVALALYFLAHCINAVKLRLFLPHLTYAQSLRFTMIAVFYGTALPGQLAGDAVKAARLTRTTDLDIGIVVAAVTVDKVIGLFALLLLTAIGIGFSHGQFPPSVAAAAVAMTAMAGGSLAVALVVPLPARLGRWTEALHAWRKLTLAPPLLLTALALGLVFQALCIALFALLGAGLGIEMPPTTWAVVVGLISVILLLPITIAGVGLREGSLMALLPMLGQSASAAVALSLSLLAINIVGAVVGFVADVAGRDCA